MTNAVEREQKLVEVISTFGEKEFTEAIYWMALGDGCIELPERGECLLSISHTVRNRDYLEWKSRILEHRFRCSLKKRISFGGFSNGSEQVRLRTQHHPEFTKVREALYGPLGRKALTLHALKLLGPLGLAILYQDDGSYHYSSDAGHNVLIHKLCFSEIELMALAKTIVENWGLIFRINRNQGKGFGFRLRLRAKDMDKFFELIDPFIVPSMLYKVGKGDKKA